MPVRRAHNGDNMTNMCDSHNNIYRIDIRAQYSIVVFELRNTIHTYENANSKKTPHYVRTLFWKGVSSELEGAIYRLYEVGLCHRSFPIVVDMRT